MKRLIKPLAVIGCGLLLALMFMTPILASDVGNSFSGGGGSSDGFSGGGGTFFMFGGMGLPGLIIFVIIYLIVTYSRQKNNGGNNNNILSSFDDSPVNETGSINAIQQNDPDFSAEKFKAFAGEVFITLQEAWEARKWQSVRPFESNALFNMHNRQMQEYLDKKVTPHLDGQNVRHIAIADYHVDGDQEVLTVKLSASVIDYDTDDETGKVITGSTTQYNNRTYRLEFIRTLGVKTDTKTGLNTTNCPNCGAPTKVTSAGECEYCGSVITNGQYGWVLNKYVKW